MINDVIYVIMIVVVVIDIVDHDCSIDDQLCWSCQLYPFCRMEYWNDSH